MRDFIIKTLLIPPILKKNILPRKRLIEFLYKNLEKKLILLVSGAGYGKTTLLTQLIDKLNHPFVFYTINKSHTNLVTFISYLIAGIRNIYKDFGTRTTHIIEEIENINLNIEKVIGTFVNEIVDTIDKELFIILDDYHLIDKTEIINKTLNYLLEYIPPNVHIIISTREAPSLSLSKLIAKDNLIEIAKEDFKFRIDEIQMLFKEIYKLDLSSSLLNEIYKFSQGWITALQLTSYIIKKNQKNVLKRLKEGKESLDYFQNEVFNQQPKEIQLFLLNSSILEQMSPTSCDIIFQKNNSKEILRTLINKNLFISCIDEEKEIFIYHPLFHNFLLNRALKLGKKYLCSLHLRAGDYFKSIKEYTYSIRHYILGNNIDKALRIVEKDGQKLIEMRKFNLLEQWFTLLPKQLIQNNPTLLWYEGEIFYWQGRYEEAMEACEKAKRKFVKLGKKEETIKPISVILKILSIQGKYKKVIKLGNEVLELFNKKENLFKVSLLNSLSSVYFFLSNYHKSASLLQEALRICKKINAPREEIKLLINQLLHLAALGEYDALIQIGEELFRKIQHSYYIGALCVILGDAYIIKGEFTLARNILKKALRFNKMYNDKREINFTLSTLGFLNLATENYELARLYFKKALTLNTKIKDRALNQSLLYNISRSYLFEERIIEAEEYINKLFSQNKLEEILPEYLITKGEVLIRSGSFGEAEKILKLALKKLGKAKNKLEVMLTHIALARLYYEKKDEKLLIKHLREAIILSKTNNYHSALIRLGKIDYFLLKFALEMNVEPQYVRFLLKEFNSKFDLRINFFGGLQIKKREEEEIIIKWKTQKSKSLFCFLLANRKKRFTREQLMELLWPGEDPKKSQNRLWYSFTFIRNTLNSFIRKGNQLINYINETYGINSIHKIWLDFEEFEVLIKEAHRWEERGKEEISISKYESAISLYQGDFLIDMYEEWSEERRVFYKREYLQIMNKVANFYFKKQNFEKVIGYCSQIIEVDKFYEPAYLLIIQAYIKTGNRKSALDLYRKLRELLKAEFHTEPSLEIKKIIQELKT